MCNLAIEIEVIGELGAEDLGGGDALRLSTTMSTGPSSNAAATVDAMLSAL